MMKTKDLRTKTEVELQQEILTLMREHFDLRIERANQQLRQPNRLKVIKRSVARIKTILNERKRQTS